MPAAENHKHHPRRVIGFRQHKLNDIAVFVTLIVEDEFGEKYEFNTSCFNFDMKPIKKSEK